MELKTAEVVSSSSVGVYQGPRGNGHDALITPTVNEPSNRSTLQVRVYTRVSTYESFQLCGYKCWTYYIHTNTNTHCTISKEARGYSTCTSSCVFLFFVILLVVLYSLMCVKVGFASYIYIFSAFLYFFFNFYGFRHTKLCAFHSVVLPSLSFALANAAGARILYYTRNKIAFQRKDKAICITVKKMLFRENMYKEIIIYIYTWTVFLSSFLFCLCNFCVRDFLDSKIHIIQNFCRIRTSCIMYHTYQYAQIMQSEIFET